MKLLYCVTDDFKFLHFIGCTVGSTHVEQQLKELRDLGCAEKARSKTYYAYNNTKTRLEADQAVFKVYKGVKCFDFSKDKNIIITGGEFPEYWEMICVFVRMITRTWNSSFSS